ncbi:MAG: glycosyltransferase family 39 protein [Bacteroidales bacterium]|nr:glycosyltransferase family 39 protein [Bacteroidales bacterium]
MNSFKKHGHWIIIAILTVASLAIRYYFSLDFSLSNDELSAVNRLNYSNLSDLIQSGIMPDGHPAGVQIMLWYITKWFGNTPENIRLPFIILSSLAPFFAFVAFKDFIGKVPALIFAIVLAFGEFPVLYGILARPYGIGLTIILFAAFAWHRLLFSKLGKGSQILWTLLLSLSWTMAAVTHYFAGLTAAVMALTGLLFLTKNNRKSYFLAVLFAIILFLPHLQITLHQLGHKGVGSWLAKPDKFWILEHLNYLFNGILTSIIMATSVIILLILNKLDLKKNNLKLSLTYFLWFLIPLLTGFIYSIKIDAVLQNSVLIFSSFFLLVSLLNLSRNTNPLISNLGATLLVLVYVTDLFFLKPLKPQNHFADFQHTAEALQQFQDSHQNIIHISHISHPNYLKYYQADLEPFFQKNTFQTTEQLCELGAFCSNVKSEYISFSNMQKGASPLTLDILRSRFGEPIASKKFGRLAEVFLFKNQNDAFQIDSSLVVITDSEFTENFDKEILTPAFDSVEIVFDYQFFGETTNAHLVITSEDFNKNTTSWQSAPLNCFAVIGGIKNVNAKIKFLLPKGTILLRTYLWNPDKRSLQYIKKKTEIHLL